MMSYWPWIGFGLFVLAMLALDLGVFHRKTHEVSIKEAPFRGARFVGAKMMLADLIKIPTVVSLVAIVGLLLTSIVASLLHARRLGSTGPTNGSVADLRKPHPPANDRAA